MATYLRKRPRQARARRTFEAIVEAAARILADEGPRSLTTNRVAARAGVSIGSLYQYFADRRAIVRALFERELERADAMRPAALDDPARPAAERLRAAVDWHFDVHAAHPDLGRVLRALLGQVLPRSEAERYASFRAERVRETLAGILGAIDDATLARASFLVDQILETVPDAVHDRAPDWLGSEPLRADVTRMLVALVDGLRPTRARRSR